jgi:3'-phosphoadenosine 5'-phosphosulfate sulfotransferase (PAPS reductase)/FAD synthetase
MQIPNLADFDIYHVGISGGKDSTDLALWAWYESGLPREKIKMAFCDTGNEDALTYAFLDMLREHFPIETIRPERDFYELAKHKKRCPSRMAQFCTQHLKVIPTREHVLALQRQGLEVVRFNGVRQAEGHSSNDRGRAEAWEWHDGDLHWIHRPILHHTIDQVWDMHRRYLSIDRVCQVVADDPTMDPDRKLQVIERLRLEGIPRNPLYVMGASRVGCYPCINSRKGELRALAKFRPERIEFLEDKEHWVGEGSRVGYSSFFARTKIPLHLRSVEITTIKGEAMQVASIRDVVDWAQTAHGGRQYDMQFEDDDLPRASACDIGGLCE